MLQSIARNPIAQAVGALTVALGLTIASAGPASANPFVFGSASNSNGSFFNQSGNLSVGGRTFSQGSFSGAGIRQVPGATFGGGVVIGDGVSAGTSGNSSFFIRSSGNASGSAGFVQGPNFSSSTSAVTVTGNGSVTVRSFSSSN